MNPKANPTKKIETVEKEEEAAPEEEDHINFKKKEIVKQIPDEKIQKIAQKLSFSDDEEQDG